MLSGYSGTPLVKKLGIKPGYKVLFVNEPKYYYELLGEFPNDVIQLEHKTEESADFIHIFCEDQEQLHNLFPIFKDKLDRNGSLWISWIKKASKKYDWSFTGNEVRDFGLSLGLVDVKVCAVDEDWSGLKFMYRREDR